MISRFNKCPPDRIPIWITNWVIGYTGGRGNTVENHIVEGVVAKGENEKVILQNKGALRKAVWVHEQSKKTSKVSRKHINEVVDKYIAISVELVKQVSFGIVE